jgi:hypothetical protein
MESFFNQLASLLVKFPAYAPFLMILFIMVFILYRAHKSDNSFTVFDLVQDNTTLKASLEKIGMIVAMLSITWWFIDTSAQGKTSVDDVMAYGGIMGLAKFAQSWLNMKYGNKPQ